MPEERQNRTRSQNGLLPAKRPNPFHPVQSSAAVSKPAPDRPAKRQKTKPPTTQTQKNVRGESLAERTIDVPPVPSAGDFPISRIIMKIPGTNRAIVEWLPTWGSSAEKAHHDAFHSAVERGETEKVRFWVESEDKIEEGIAIKGTIKTIPGFVHFVAIEQEEGIGDPVGEAVSVQDESVLDGSIARMEEPEAYSGPVIEETPEPEPENDPDPEEEATHASRTIRREELAERDNSGILGENEEESARARDIFPRDEAEAHNYDNATFPQGHEEEEAAFAYETRSQEEAEAVALNKFAPQHEREASARSSRAVHRDEIDEEHINDTTVQHQELEFETTTSPAILPQQPPSQPVVQGAAPTLPLPRSRLFNRLERFARRNAQKTRKRSLEL